MDQANYIGRFQCLPYSRRQRFSGVWVIAMEHSSFFPGASGYEDIEGRPDRIWLAFEPTPSPEVMAADEGAEMRRYVVDFAGRRSLCDFHYGHLGLWPQEIVAERVISIRPLSGQGR